MTTHKELVERLNNASNGIFDVHPLGDYGICEEAAQAISTLTAEIEELRAALRRVQDEANTVGPDWRETASMIDSICIATLTKAEGTER